MKKYTQWCHLTDFVSLRLIGTSLNGIEIFNNPYVWVAFDRMKPAGRHICSCPSKMKIDQSQKWIPKMVA